MGCCRPGGCCANGCFSHASFLCLGWEFGANEDVCECVVPCFSYLRAPGKVKAELCCYSLKQVEAGAPPQDGNVPLDIQCMSNLYICSFAFGQYLPPSLARPMTPIRGQESTSPPTVQTATRTLGTLGRKEIPGVGKRVTSPMGAG